MPTAKDCIAFLAVDRVRAGRGGGVSVMTDYAELRAKAEAATPGPWIIYDGSSWRRIGTENMRGQYDIAVLYPYNARTDGHPDLASGDGNTAANLAYIAAANPQAILALLDSHKALVEALEEAAEGVEAAMGQVELGVIPNWDWLREVRRKSRAVLAAAKGAKP